MSEKYYFNKCLDLTFEELKNKVIEELKKEGFGVLTEIDIKAKLKEKLNVDFKKYKILGACNPSLAYQALQVEDKIGVMLPCNIIIQELANGQVEAAAINPNASMQAVGSAKLNEIAGEVSQKLQRVINNL